MPARGFGMTVQGTADPRFAAVREDFERNFADRDEVGASVCVTVDGKTVVDLWGGIANPGTKAPWNEDTVAVVWSCTKGATALCAHMLAARGVIDLDAPVARYWPEFAKGGKHGVTDPTSIPGMVVWNSGGILLPGAVNTRQVHAAEIPSANGITNARGLAGMYRPLALGGEFNGVRLVPEDAIPAMGAVSAAVAKDAVMLVPTRWATGFLKGSDNHPLPPGHNDRVLLSEEAFGHLRNGGSLGFAAPKARLSFGYVMNRLGGGIGLERRGQALVDAVYRALGYRRAASGGMWYA